MPRYSLRWLLALFPLVGLLVAYPFGCWLAVLMLSPIVALVFRRAFLTGFAITLWYATLLPALIFEPQLVRGDPDRYDPDRPNWLVVAQIALPVVLLIAVAGGYLLDRVCRWEPNKATGDETVAANNNALSDHEHE